jgi:hypothetical protein
MTEALTVEQVRELLGYEPDTDVGEYDTKIAYCLAEREELETRVLRYLADLDPNDMAAA